jgi:uncharacterized protein (TIGR02246 family)
MTADERTIRNLIAQWHRATAAGDVETVLGLMSEDAVFLVCGSSPMRGRVAFEEGLRGILKTHRIDSKGEVLECKVSGEFAYCWSQLTVRIAPLSGGESTVRSGSALSIFQKQTNGSWQLIRDANLLGPAS